MREDDLGTFTCLTLVKPRGRVARGRRETGTDQIVRTFVRLRRLLHTNEELVRKVERLRSRRQRQRDVFRHFQGDAHSHLASCPDSIPVPVKGGWIGQAPEHPMNKGTPCGMGAIRHCYKAANRARSRHLIARSRLTHSGNELRKTEAVTVSLLGFIIEAVRSGVVA
jgi:hypothetical protein